MSIRKYPLIYGGTAVGNGLMLWFWMLFIRDGGVTGEVVR